jgi:hypothetical protein
MAGSETRRGRRATRSGRLGKTMEAGQKSTSAAEARNHSMTLAARLKSCPSRNPREPDFFVAAEASILRVNLMRSRFLPKRDYTERVSRSSSCESGVRGH